ncbi:energy-coupling factor transporter transmembrane component T family protein [Lentilactobacillus sp. SPB1-3]|uniref:Energy-coupling factor transporter transmembrane protein EcfT n=1 Tax=Lentilactobacillus terminaliae TaxID=3003483 RepID=A0ACD5DEY8_9LACO|nr:energy-coupling factor transporter transmembrane component T [Lentilactobacillus sp. SPB1-3]MCZ0976460.1 energy-coupling factor transporter transmembrane component T [Lentilactobacillus sp. SPB1-3]
MEDTFIINYLPGEHAIQKLNGTTKIVLLIANLLLIMLTFDVRILTTAFLINFCLLLSEKPKWQTVKAVTWFVIWMNVVNVAMMFLVSPNIGSTTIGQSTVLFSLTNNFPVTAETVFYLSVRLLKVFSMFVASLWFILAITPSQLAEGLYRLHVPYKVCTVMSLGLRSIPDIMRDYKTIKNSLQMRGLELDKKKSSMIQRVRLSVKILMPLLMATFNKVGTISTAMELRLYGIKKQRSYYTYQKPLKLDWTFRVLAIIEIVFAITYLFIEVFVIRGGLSYVWYPGK